MRNNNPTVLNVAEKPSVARALARVFASMPGAQDQGMIRNAHQIFTHNNVRFPSVFSQGQGVLIQNGNDSSHTMITTSVRGHLAAQEFGQAYGWRSCAPRALFHAPIETIYKDDMIPLEQMLRQQARRSDAVILWLDCDREGEAIGDEVRHVCLDAKRNLQIYRARFSTVLPNEIQRALRSLGRLNEHFVQAVQARSQIDLRIGAAFTRFQTLRLQKKFDNLSNGVLSYGPCQFPALGFCVERWARIRTFVPDDFWYIELTLRVDAATGDAERGGRTQQQVRAIYFSWKRNRLYDRLTTLVLYDSCLDAEQAEVTSLTGRPKNKWRPVPLATVELQKRASRFLRIGAETLMKAAEELYQQGLISYPRTETERFSPEFQHRPLIQQFTGLAQGEFSNYAAQLLNNNGFQNPRHGQHDDKAHPPITPCKAVDPETIGDHTQRSVYKLVVKHYLACCSRDAIGRETVITVKMATEEFTATGLMIMEKNWLEIYAPWERWSTGQGELPRLEVGSRITPSSLLMKEGRTTPPQPLTEAELIALMDRNGIGTDATIAQHISTIQERSYAIKDGQQRFHPTLLGIALVEGYNSMGYQLNKPDLRREMEHECNLVANGHKTKEDIIEPILRKMRECFERVNQEARKLDEAVGRHFPRLGLDNQNSVVLQANFSECGQCQNMMAVKQSQTNNNNTQIPNRKLLFCQTCRLGLGLPTRGDFQALRNPENTGVPVKCPICQYQIVKVVQGNGYNGNGYTMCPKCFTDPPVEHGGLAGTGDFRCFQCQHPTCSLAGGTPGGDVEAFPCQFCQTGRISLKKNTRGFVLSCSNYSSPQRCSYTIWLPKEASSVSIPENSFCGNCSRPGKQVSKVQFTFRPGSIPPHIDRESTVCILCDTDFRSDLNVRLPRPSQVTSNNRRSTSSTTTNNRANTTPSTRRNVWEDPPSRGGGGRGGRGAVGVGRGGRGRGGRGAVGVGRGGRGSGNLDHVTCYKCNQQGHFANNCPGT